MSDADVDVSSSLQDLARLPVVLLPVGAISASAFERYAALLRRCADIDVQQLVPAPARAPFSRRV